MYRGGSPNLANRSPDHLDYGIHLCHKGEVCILPIGGVESLSMDHSSAWVASIALLTDIVRLDIPSFG